MAVFTLAVMTELSMNSPGLSCLLAESQLRRAVAGSASAAAASKVRVNFAMVGSFPQCF